MDRLEAWQKKLGITRQEVEEVVMHPTQLVPGDLEAWVAQSRRGLGLLRVPYMQVGDNRRILTIYWTTKVDKYWRGE